jgi:multidrug efflux pump subunit AcrB
VPGEFASPAEIFGLVVGTHEGQPVYLKDVARVLDGFKDEDTRSRLNGREAVTLAVKKRAGENIIPITDAIDALIERESPAWPTGTEIVKVMDKARDIRAMVADLENNILSGLVLVVIVLLFFLGLRNATIVGMAIPFSMLLSFIVLYALGITLNMVVLFSLTLALGMLVDNAIVIVENIYRYMEQGVPAVEASMRATSEVAYPVIGSTLTTLVAFGPMLLWPGIMGEFMSYLPLTLIVTLSASLFVAMVINPALAAFFMKVPAGGARVGGEADLAGGEKPVDIRGPVLAGYEGLLRLALRHRAVVLLGSFVMLVLLIEVWLLAVGVEKPVEFFPFVEPKSMYINVDMPEGADLEFSDRVLRQAEMRVAGITREEINDPSLSTAELYRRAYEPKEHDSLGGGTYAGPSDLDNVKYIYSRAVAVPAAGMAFEPTTPNNLGVQFIDIEDRTVPTSRTVELVRERTADIPGGKVTVAAAEEGPPTGAPINIEISGPDFEALGAIAEVIRKEVEAVPFVEDVRDDYIAGRPTVRVSIDRQRAAMLGLSTEAIGFALKTGYNGLDVSTFRQEDEDYDITVQLSRTDREALDALQSLLIPVPGGGLVPLRSIATIDYGGSLGEITRINGERVVTVKANVDETRVPGAVAREQAERMLAGVSLPPGYKVRFTGEFEFQKEAEDFLSKAFVVALFLIFLVLVTMFNSVMQPLIIMTAVVLSLGGAFLGLAVFRSPFGIIMTGVGVISLAGVVVNNGIVLVDYVNKLRERGHGLDDALVRGGATRLRPVALTAITTVLGLIPMVTGISYDFHTWRISWVSESSQWWRSMAIVVIFGLGVATVLTLVVVPVLYSLMHSVRDGVGRAASWVRRMYWLPYERLTGRQRPER